ncbi:DNA-binding transcriptional MerR regulator [Deinococcus sp. HSC-46F16]|uniref:MerR family transcriptional regulator n=1 Tax=Deinococcus sp. HSC-46F16 TaxID=2910968 RepID=UPI00209D3224|nr:MerR family transcriptional regulator [Deinococcus sp. HSC-46F16]MCP2013234.1 DNA-binding transcriptional MerR regulator [Deinococcus sp. HSC-46F16]
MPGDTLPDTTPLFTAAEAEMRTGVPAATLRQWERRYGIPAPARSASGYRMYSPLDLAQIGRMQALLQGGVPASRAAELARQEHAPPPSPAPIPRPSTTPQKRLSDDLLAALLQPDLEQAAVVLGRAHAQFPVEEVVLAVMAPALAEVGTLWARGEITIAHEHQASAYLRGRLMGLLELAGRAEFGPRVLAACAPGERHEIGLLILVLLLRRRGVQAEYLGADLPLADLAAYARHRPADAVLLGLNGEWALEPTRAQLGALRGLRIPVFYGGGLLNARPALAAEFGGHFAGADAHKAADTIVAALRPGAQDPQEES